MTTDRSEPLIVGPGEGAKIEGPVGGPLTFKARGEQTNSALTAFENVVPPGQGPPLHRHAHEDELCYSLESARRFKLGVEISPRIGGLSFVVRCEKPHVCFQNVGEGAARILVMFTPAGMEHFFDHFALLSAPGPSDFATIGGPLGMTVLGLPLGSPTLSKV